MRLAYILKRYPRYSETFIVNEILAHEQAELDVQIYALLPPQDTHFQDIISRVRAPVIYLSPKAERASLLWGMQQKVAREYPGVWDVFAQHPGISAREALQALELSLYIQKQNITHLHAHFATAATTVAQLASGITGIPYSFTAHAKDIFHQDNDFDALIQKFSEAACAITVSDYNLKYLRHELSIPGQSLRRIYNGLDLEKFGFTPPQKRRPIILSVGRLVEKKGFPDLIDACQILRSKGVDFRCRITGSGDLESALKEQVNRLDLSDVVEMTGPRPQAEIMQDITEAAIFAAPCIVGNDGNRDGLPTVLLESMALGTPCVSTDVTGIPEVILHEKTGLMVPQKDPQALAHALERLLADGALGMTLAENARQLMEREFDIHKNAERIRTCFSGREPVTLNRIAEKG